MSPATLAAGSSAVGTPIQLGGGQFLYWAVVLFVLAVVAGLAGFRGIAGLTMEAARILVVVFLVLAVVTLLL